MKKVHNLIGVGIGPSNLSTAALIHPHRENISSIFFEMKNEFAWYPGMLFPNAKMQVSFLKDLVTMIDPSNQFSFLNFLKDTGRLYMFAAKGMNHVIRRQEFEQYFKWVIERLPNLHFGSKVESIIKVDGIFEVIVNGEKHYAHNISLGTGKSANVPEFCVEHLGKDVIHSTQFLTSGVNTKQKEVVVVGGGQSAVEIILDLIRRSDDSPANIHWISSPYNLMTLEDSPFANELYTPNYSNFFYELDDLKKAQLIDQQKYTSDGVSADSLDELYEELYNVRFMEQRDPVKFYFHAKMIALEKNEGRYVVEMFCKNKNQNCTLQADIVVLSTGLKNSNPQCLKGIEDTLIKQGDNYSIDENFAIRSNDEGGKVFVHNGARHVRGVADPNLSLLAWRSAIIINGIAGREVYKVDKDQSIVTWKNQLDTTNDLKEIEPVESQLGYNRSKLA